MARKRRIRPEDGIFHIICKSIKEVTLFEEAEDKKMYLLLIKKYKLVFDFKIYGYCLMDNHAHLMIDANGADISKVMHGINFSYAMYYNKKYKRDGHLFKDRFVSKVVDNVNYLKTLSLYIHNNPTAIGAYKDCPQNYFFSSLGIYLGNRHDPFNLVDYGFVMDFFGKDIKSARRNYRNRIFKCNDEILKEEIEFKYERTEYHSGRKILVRNFTSKDIIEFVALKMNISKIHFNIKYSRKLVQARALAVVLMRSLCNFKSSDISAVLGNITQSRISKLSNIGIGLIEANEEYENVIAEFIKCYA
ncbi:transposase [Clostridium bowmanii]|uniref:transposase n=1 Tax=Clostridium bowmanii TaxID=132925 RepID=UPI001C0B7A29|nr:transposase [Clostridium bowmanii]MBU3192005.1 transposase [Clostridium bowmanii]MCA1076275.1 transposase [Clostridium bowmanii]